MRAQFALRPPALLTFAGAAALVATYAVLASTGTDANSASAQLVHLLAALLAASFTAACAWAAPARSHARSSWALFSLAVWSLAAATALTTLYQFGRGWGEATLRLAHLLSLSALLLVLCSMAFAAGIDRRHAFWVARMTANAVALVVAAYAVVFAVWTSRLESAVMPTEGVVLSLYSLAGLLLLAFSGLLWTEVLAVRDEVPAVLVQSGVVFYALGLVLTPLWRFASTGPTGAPWSETVIGVLLVLGYALVFAGSATRLEDSDATSAEPPSLQQRQASPALDMIVSVVVLAAVLGSGWASIYAATSVANRTVYMTVLLASAILMVFRTALFSFHDQRLHRRLLTDAVTGAENPRGLEARGAEYVAAATRFGEDFTLIVIGLDGFLALAARLGSAGADQVLAEVAGALAGAFEGTGYTFRLGPEEFAILATVNDDDAAAWMGSLARTVVTSVFTDGPQLECSVGYALCPDDALTYQQLLAKAERAMKWAKSHGGARVARFSEAIAHATLVDTTITSIESDSRLQIARALSAVLDAREPGHQFHRSNVAVLSRLLASDLALEHDHVERVEVAALLHDVGRIAIDCASRSPRAGAHSAAENDDHPQLGSRVLESLGFAEVSDWVLHHHERWDGNGYPEGLAGGHIPLESRIIALADQFDHCISGASYGAPMSRAAALQDIDLGIGTRFDPELAERFITLVARTGAFDMGRG